MATPNSTTAGLSSKKPSLPSPSAPTPNSHQPSPLPTNADEADYVNLLVLISGNGTNLQALINACGQDPALAHHASTARATPASSSSSSSFPSSSSSEVSLPHTRVTHVVSNRSSAYGLERAAAADIPTTYHNLVRYKKLHPATAEGVAAARERYDADLAQLVVGSGGVSVTPRPDLVVCAGWMHILSAGFIASLAEAGVDIINLHPALPGEYSGSGAIERAWEDFQKKEGSSSSSKRPRPATGVMVHYVVPEVDMGEPVVVQEVEMREGETLAGLETRIHEVEWKVIVEGVRRAAARIRQRRRKEPFGKEVGH